MPERKYKSKKKYPSDEVQGADSWVIIKRPTWEDFGDLISKNGEVSELEMGEEMIGDLVEAWNWVDDDGKPLPEPTPEVIKGLPIEELNFLIGCFDFAETIQKKD